jgi:hypothetical protein
VSIVGRLSRPHATQKEEECVTKHESSKLTSEMMDERPISSHCRRNGLRRFKRPRCLSASFTRACFFGYHIQQKKEVETCGFISLTLISTCLVLLPHWYLVRCPGLWEDTGNLSLNGWAICQPPSNSKSGMHTHLSYLQGKGVIFDREILPALVTCVTWTHTLSVFQTGTKHFPILCLVS